MLGKAETCDETLVRVSSAQFRDANPVTVDIGTAPPVVTRAGSC
jgi:hypothetical protein